MIGFELEVDARRVMEVLPQRMGKYGLSLHPDKTRLLPFRRPPKGQGSGQGEAATFDFLGFTFYWARARTGRWGMCVQDSQRKPETGDQVHLRLVSKPSTPAGTGPARSSREASARSLQLLRRERELS